jgi:hypothetical protein
MEYFWALLLIFLMWAFTTTLSAFLGVLVPIIFLRLSYIIAVESYIIGFGGLIGSVINIFYTNIYLKTHGAMSKAPMHGLGASLNYIFGFLISITLLSIFDLSYYIVNLVNLALIIVAIVNWIITKSKAQSIENVWDKVSYYKVVEKYDTDPKWATFLTFEDGREQWNETIPNSFLAKNPENDLTFVHLSREDAINYAERTFKNAVLLEEN